MKIILYIIKKTRYNYNKTIQNENNYTIIIINYLYRYSTSWTRWFWRPTTATIGRWLWTRRRFSTNANATINISTTANVSKKVNNTIKSIISTRTERKRTGTRTRWTILSYILYKFSKIEICIIL